jgi:cytochrome P450
MSDVPPVRADISADLIRSWNLDSDRDASTCPFKAMSKLHDGPDIFFNTGSTLNASGAQGGTWVVTRHELQREIEINFEVFSNRGLSNFSELLGEDWPMFPVELDAPEHMKYRAPLNLLFSPNKVNALEESVRNLAIDLIEAIRGNGECEFMRDFGRPYPIGVFLRLVDLPTDHMTMFVSWVDGLFRGETREIRVAAARGIKDYLVKVIADRQAHPGDDLFSVIVNSKIDGEAMSDDVTLGMCYLFFLAGLDTVAATLSFSFQAMAQEPELQSQLRDDPQIAGDAVEEFLRAFAVVNSRRTLKCDYEFHGVKMKKGEWVDLPGGLAARDDREFPDPHVIDFKRENVRHIAFHAGPHRCIGSHLARREIKIALEEWTKRIPEFRIKPGEVPTSHVQGVMGVNYLPLVW